MVRPKRLGYNIKLFPQIDLCGMCTNFNCSDTPMLNWSFVCIATGCFLLCQLKMLEVIKSVQCAKHGTYQTAPSSHLSLYWSHKTGGWGGRVEITGVHFFKYLGGSVVILGMKLSGFTGGAEQRDPPPFLGAQQLNSSIRFRGAEEFSPPSLMLSYCCCLEVLIHLWGAPEREVWRTSNAQ